MKKIRDLVVDDTFEMFVLIKQADVRLAKNGKKFIAFTFQDGSGNIDGKFWGATEDEIERYKAGKVVFLNGKREVYQNTPQVKIIKLRLATEEEPYQAELYMEKSPVQKEDLAEEINQTIFEITNATWNRIVRHLLVEHQTAFYEYPAAKNFHHAFVGGLAVHTVSMLRIAKSLCKEYPALNASLLYSGVLLHDLGKVIELSGPIGTEYTLAGNLLGHIVIVDEEISKACVALKIDEQSEDVIVLKHMILAHHGQLDYGSPVRPRIMEAEVLHQIDNIDASMQMMMGALEQVEPGQYTNALFGMDGRRFYRPNSK
ncbi:HD domain-containing protein [Vagococcus coleopterorum]|uniref:HD domain-containing protein n=1 Tax=Vagococcus coleopterorum TaxID=2714946 RepID=A0A6G8AL76_9ENTE|nr:HD domain-containing protein [Vagococcus coleopterorum]QIL45712.1 HD domain-containing protein [Vagococcus coleopterorum]